MLHGKQYLSHRVPPPPPWSRSGPLPSVVQQLTPRQVEILRELGRGKGHATLAEEFGISRHTLNFHLRHLRELLGVEGDDELVQAGQVLHMTTDRE